MPYYVVDTMGLIPGLSGLFVAGIFSASLSTVSAALNSLAAVSIEDYYKVNSFKYLLRNLKQHNLIKTDYFSKDQLQMCTNNYIY